jgi:hypothetical protein
VQGGYTSEMACIFHRNKFQQLQAIHSDKFLQTEKENKMCGYFMQDNATDCTGNFQMTALEDRFSKLLVTHVL